eukprot:TRINITY_DN945_c0_g1_i1.p1 TRINITY_DN945_c0_g1~~TRINITY_DN945_c0_g1_i1.p1  ORF type:complete len:127 (+),score=47.42 TRINITY_DN945_c0_g1_i1:112-492(+)
MSWDGYVTDQLVGSGHIEAGAILGADGSTWAMSPSLGLKAGEGAAIAALMKNTPDVFAKGVTIAGVKYMGIKGQERSVYGKKGATGVVLIKTGQAIVVGRYNDKQQPGNAANVGEKLADYLIENGY